MKILVFVKEFASPTLTFIYNEVNELAKHHEVLILTCERKYSERFPFENVVEIPFHSNTFWSKYSIKLQYLDFSWAFKSRAFRKKLLSIISEFKPDVLHTHFGFESRIILENLNLRKIPIFISFHGYDASHKLSSSRYRNAIKGYFNEGHIHPIFVSNFMRENVSKILNMDLSKKDILYYGTDTDFFKRTNYSSDRSTLIFLQVSSFAEKKGHEYTLKAFQKFVLKNIHSKVKLIFAGDGPLRMEMERLTEELKLKEVVEFKGLVNKEEARSLMEEAHFFVHHSVTSASKGDMEGIPNALMEAMAMELPILSTYHSGIPELVENGVNGFLVKERDIDHYAQRFKDICEWNFKKENRQKVEVLFEKKQHAALLNSFYEKVVKS